MLLAVRISNYGRTWEVWRALNKLSRSRLRLMQLLRIFRALQTSRVHPYELDIRTLRMNKFLSLRHLEAVLLSVFFITNLVSLQNTGAIFSRFPGEYRTRTASHTRRGKKKERLFYAG